MGLESCAGVDVVNGLMVNGSIVCGRSAAGACDSAADSVAVAAGRAAGAAGWGSNSRTIAAVAAGRPVRFAAGAADRAAGPRTTDTSSPIQCIVVAASAAAASARVVGPSKRSS